MSLKPDIGRRRATFAGMKGIAFGSARNRKNPDISSVKFGLRSSYAKRYPGINFRNFTQRIRTRTPYK